VKLGSDTGTYIPGWRLVAFLSLADMGRMGPGFNRDPKYRLNLDDGFDFDGGAEGQGGDTEGSAGMLALVAQHTHQEV
jgi:hypothetical protein